MSVEGRRRGEGRATIEEGAGGRPLREQQGRFQAIPLHHVPCATQEFAPTPASVPATRRFVGRFFRDAGATADAVDTAQLCVSEAATNAIRHTGLAYTVTCTALDDGRIAVEVLDRDPRAAPVRHHASADDENGRGLELLDALAEWHVTATATGKTLTFVLKEDC